LASFFANSGGARLNFSENLPSNWVWQLLDEAAVGVQARDFVLVLVGHQLEQRLGDGHRQLVAQVVGASAARTLSTRSAYWAA
jgi:hypothetical protein